MIVAALTFVVLASLLLWSVIGGKGKWWWKLPLIAAVPAFMLAIWFGLVSFNGYPVRESLPAKSLFVYGYYVDPDPLTHTKGAIYIWVIPPQKHSINPYVYSPEVTEPRAYRLPYNESEAEQIQNATTQTKAGHQVELRVKTKGSHQGHGSSAGGQFKSYVLPPPSPPQKNH